MGLHLNSIEIIRELYRDCHTTIVCEGQSTDRLAVNVGVGQGCPLSMLLFNIGINPILNKLDLLGFPHRVRMGETSISCMAYVDDLVFFGTSSLALQTLVNTASKYIKLTGMEFRRSKCAYMDFPCHENNQICLDDQPIPHKKADEGYVYLGCFISRLLRHTPEQVIKNVLDDLEILKNSVLSPSQKLHAYQTFVHSKMVFYFRNTYIPFPDLTAFTTGWDVLVRMKHKELLSLPVSASTGYLYSFKVHGGVGLTSTFDEYLVQSVTHSYYLLTSPDIFVKEAARITLRHASKLMSRVSILDWINTGYKQSAFGSWWNKIQHVIHVLHEKYGITVKFGDSHPS